MQIMQCDRCGKTAGKDEDDVVRVHPPLGSGVVVEPRELCLVCRQAVAKTFSATLAKAASK